MEQLPETRKSVKVARLITFTCMQMLLPVVWYYYCHFVVAFVYRLLAIIEVLAMSNYSSKASKAVMIKQFPCLLKYIQTKLLSST